MSSLAEWLGTLIYLKNKVPIFARDMRQLCIWVSTLLLVVQKGYSHSYTNLFSIHNKDVESIPYNLKHILITMLTYMYASVVINRRSINIDAVPLANRAT